MDIDEDMLAHSEAVRKRSEALLNEMNKTSRRLHDLMVKSDKAIARAARLIANTPQDPPHRYVGY